MNFSAEYMKYRTEEWSNRVIVPYCRECRNTCCNPSRIMINVEKKETDTLKLFTGVGLRVYESRELDLRSVEGWMRKVGEARFLGESRLAAKVLTKEGREVPKPSLIEAGIPEWDGKNFRLGGETDFSLYADSCPFYGEEKGCLVHGDPRRPSSCKQYPLNFETEDGTSIITVHNSCPAMNDPKIKRQLQMDFPDIPLISLSKIIASLMHNSQQPGRTPVRKKRKTQNLKINGFF